MAKINLKKYEGKIIDTSGEGDPIYIVKVSAKDVEYIELSGEFDYGEVVKGMLVTRKRQKSSIVEFLDDYGYESEDDIEVFDLDDEAGSIGFDRDH